MTDKNMVVVFGRGIIPRSLRVILVVFLSLHTALFANADETQKAAASHQTESREFSKPFGDIVSAAQSLINAGEFKQGISELEFVLKRQSGSPYEISTTYQLLGNAYYNSDNYSAAIESFETAIEAGGLLPNEATTLRINIVQLLIGNDQFVRGAEMLEQWERDGGVLKPAHIHMLYQAWLQAEEYEKALPWAKLWFDTANPKTRKHYDLLNYLYHTLKMPAQQEVILKQMVTVWPEDKELWSAWASLLINTGRERDAFEVTRMIYLRGLYTSERDLNKVIQYYVFYGMPNQAAEILETEIKAGRIRDTEVSQRKLAQLWKQAREDKKALPALEKVVVHKSTFIGDKTTYEDVLRLAKAKAKIGQCEDIQTLIGRVDPGWVSVTRRLHMLVGVCYYDSIEHVGEKKCYYNDEEKRQALETKWRMAKRSFTLVAESQAVLAKHRKSAQKWLSFIETERNNLDVRCYPYTDTERERCLIGIKQAYANVVFVGAFVLDDEQACRSYVAEYDSLYRKPKK